MISHPSCDARLQPSILRIQRATRWLALLIAPIACATLASPRGEPIPLTGLHAISTGGGHTCALADTAGVKCWGFNDYGQLGDGTTTSHLTQVDVVALGIDVEQISTGSEHTCALTTTGAVKCWGRNSSGQLGDGSASNRLTPVTASGLGSGVQAITTGSSHTCALTSTGAVKCWGMNQYGQLGDGSTTDRLTTVDVVGLGSDVQAISAGGYHTCAVTTAGAVKCWGYNSDGQLGNGSTTNRLTPVDVVGLGNGVQAITTGSFHTCALTTFGAAKCWGSNQYGLLGDGSTTRRLTPVDVVGLSSAVQAISASYEHTCALTNAGSVKCWGGNDYGQLGNGSTTERYTPVDVFGLGNGVQAISTRSRYTCALTTAGSAKCWGENYGGNLGDGTAITRLTPVDVLAQPYALLTPLTGVQMVSAGYHHTCGLTTSGAIKCWGENWKGQLGDGLGGNVLDLSLTPVDALGLGSGVQAISAGYQHTCALTSVGATKCWGENNSGQLGDGSTTRRLTPVDVVGLGSGVLAIITRFNHTCALTTNGAVKCWGLNQVGQLGDGSTTNRFTPVNVVGLGGGVQAISTGTAHTCAVTTAGGVKCWGSNNFGVLGDGSTTGRLTPVDVVGLDSSVQAISAGAGHTCALTTSGAVKCWGQNFRGQLGDGNGGNEDNYSLIPVDVVSLGSGVQAISAGGYHTCALTTTGAVKCWGQNFRGQLGDGSTIDRLTPVDVFGLNAGGGAISAGPTLTCSATDAGGAKCWGENYYGNLGDGTRYDRRTPVDVLVPAPDAVFQNGFE